jgi:hypothetical protein
MGPAQSTCRRTARSRRAGPGFVFSLPTPACERTHRPERERAFRRESIRRGTPLPSPGYRFCYSPERLNEE